jgi:excisionase family DNA binding protein
MVANPQNLSQMTKVEQLERDLKTLKSFVSVDKDEVFTVEETAIFLKIGVTSVYKMAKAGEIPMTRKAGNYRILKSRLIEWINKP